MTVIHDDRPRGLSVEEAQKAVDEFLAEYNGNIPVTAVVRATQEEIYGPQASREKLGYRIDGAYHPARRIFTLAASNMGDEGAVRRALRHELLGHYGLNTFSPTEKRALLDRVLETRHEPSLSHIWKRVERDYASLPDLHKAEEVFAFVAEEERSFLGRAWDGVRAALQRALRATGLSSRPLTLAELRDVARDIARGIRAGDREQQTFPQSDTAQFRLDPERHAEILRDIQTQALGATRPAQRPVAIILGGQPGAGKAGLASAALEELAGNAVKIDADELRKNHPAYIALMREDDRAAADRTHGDAGPWAVKLTSAAMAARRNLIVDGTMRDPDNLAKLCRKLREAGYRIEARVMAVNPLVSRLSIHERYERQVRANGFGRWSNRDKHDAAFSGVPLTVEKLEAQQLVDRMTVFARNSDEPIYDNRLVAGHWEQPPAGRERVDAERARNWSPVERHQFADKLDAIARRLEQRGDGESDLTSLAELRADFERQHPTDRHAPRVTRRDAPKPGG
ncbi:zeta toxin family protein [Xanthomonas euvesicatoria pv. euvesicatoria]|uniref:zeta toxin family protein n=1 Tax=Xanthomonas TaxID=338 RepID=UPI00093876D1|nr:zeta toxin family protein [Xanthomonas euvesicatoria]APO88782.1 toxin [Xanthomonas euvesicatoria]MCC8514227.1 zeta toxin family protein [Xanthomonas euvesicatoria pv. euvesicatoria]MCC8547973.1 zeta toxin family protein [Xanthomonas euvesicatoria pv. euvesicatoria]MCC8612052.1 zeta toxin family protein [Xanthomonas euvesicatoria pv. euvesicatoria]